MKRINLIYSALIFVLAFSSCSDYLDLEPISSETSATAYETADDIEAALVGVYSTFQVDHYIWNNILFSEVRSDNYYAGGDNSNIYELDYLSISTTNSKVETSWANLYNGVLKANTVLDKLPNINDSELTDERREQIEGEALFLRACFYFDLVCLWGDVPLVLEPTESADGNVTNVSRTDSDEVYAQIIEDLNKADSLLPDTYGSDASVNKARATAGATNALAAKVAAQMGDYEKALKYIAKVESSNANYTLLSDYTYLFDGNHYNNDESILEVQFTGSDNGNWAPQMYLPPSISGDSWRKFLTPSHDLINAYEEAGDEIRKNASILFEEVDWVDEFWNNEYGSSIPFAYKMKNASSYASTDRNYILRYGDILLLKAEALNETDNPSEALTSLNKVRERVELDDLSITDKDELRTAILNERRLELAQEGQRWNDLARHNLLISTMNNLVETDLSDGSEMDYNMTEAKKLLPIPQAEIDVNPNLEQNPL